MNLHYQRLDGVQKGAVEQAVDLLKSQGKCLVVMTTGTGKTMTGAKIIEALLKNKSDILWLTQTEELIFQTRDDLGEFFGPNNVGILKGKIKEFGRRITVASVQTLAIPKWLKLLDSNTFALVVVDEAHHAPARTWKGIIDYFDCMKLGLTATPHRNDGLELEELFGNYAIALSYDEAKKLKLIASEVYRVVLTNSQLYGISRSTGNYKPKDLDRLVVSENRNQIIADAYLKYGRPFMKKLGLQPKTICFCLSVKHAERMAKFFNNMGIKADYLVGRAGKKSSFETRLTSSYALKMKRRKIFEAFKNGTGAEILCAVNVLNEGKNIVDVGCILMARPTRSRIIYHQQVGRGCRRIEGIKEEFLILDYVDMMNQKYPPMNMSRISGLSLTLTDFILDYYEGSDPVVRDELIHYLSSDYAFYPQDKWNKKLASDLLVAFYKKHGSIAMLDLRPHVTGLPGRSTIRRFWKTESICFQELGIPWRTKNVMTKDEVITALREFEKKNGKIRITDLGNKNNLPSQKTIYSFFGTWTKACKEIGFYKAPKIAPRDKRRFKTAYRGVWQYDDGWRAEIYHEKKRYNVGYFKTAEEARDAYLKKAEELGKIVRSYGSLKGELIVTDGAH